MKTCCLCEVEKAESEFVKNKNTKDGLLERCKQCSKVTREMIIDYEAGKVYWKYSNGMFKEIGSKNNHGYLCITFNKKIIKIHRLIYETYYDIKLKPEDIIDHVDRNKLNNRINNLRILTNQQNSQNQIIRKNTSSKYKGVYWYKQSNKWVGQISYNHNKIRLGYFNNEEDAARAYNKKAEELNAQGCCYSLNQI